MDELKKVLGTSFYIGLLPLAPGTWASFAVLIPVYFLHYFFGTTALVIFAIVSSLITIWTADACTKAWGDDPGQMVMDEWAGQTIVFLLVPFGGNIIRSIIVLLLGFGFFRFFDILKPLGVNKLQKVPGGWGILLDDILAGFYANICLNSFILFLIK